MTGLCLILTSSLRVDAMLLMADLILTILMESDSAILILPAASGTKIGKTDDETICTHPTILLFPWVFP